MAKARSHQQDVELRRLKFAEMAHYLTLAEVDFQHYVAKSKPCIDAACDRADAHRFQRTAEFHGLHAEVLLQSEGPETYSLQIR